MTIQLSDTEKSRFISFIKHRRLNHRLIELLVNAKAQHNLKGADLRTAKNLSYADITVSVLKSINKNWITVDDVVALLDLSEVAGKQHICVFRLPDRGKKAIGDTLRTPSGVVDDSPTLADFHSLPTDSKIRLLKSTNDVVIAKIIAQRSYWITNVLKRDPEREVFEKVKHRERSAIIVKYNRKRGTLQVRVPPREKGPGETGKAVYQFIKSALGAHYPVDSKSWFHKLVHFPIGDSFTKILRNTSDFELWYDSPEDSSTKTRISRKGRPKKGIDLRKEKNWQYQNGYARNTLRGFWSCPRTADVYIHMNADNVRVSKSTMRAFARMFVPDLCLDEDIDHVIQRVQDHI